LITSSTKLLIVEDNRTTRERLLAHLAFSDYEIETADSLAMANDLFEWMQPQLVLLDLKLPDGSGYSFARKLQNRVDVGLIIITSLDHQDNMIKGLELGADHYLTKPVNSKELLLKLEKLRRRVQIIRLHQPRGKGCYRFNGWKLDLESGTLHNAKGEPCPLSESELQILKVFIHNPKIDLSRDRILVLVGKGEDNIHNRVVDAFILRLRKKIELDHKNPLIIQTVFGKGYKFCADVKEL
jgi:two-component system, OmpR family, response regulator